MRRSVVTIGLALAVALALAALAGEGQKCSYETQTCLNHLAAHLKDRGWAGVELDHAEGGSGMKVTKVLPGTPAERAGLKAGDLLVAINGVRLGDEHKEGRERLDAEMKPGASATFTVQRAGKSQDYKLTLEKMPEDVMARVVGNHMLQHASVEVAAKE